jgi:hypothetical protein
MGIIAMKWVETSTHSFIVKIWLEETAEESGEAKWRGCVTHVSSGERRYVESFDAIASFIAGYLEAMGVRFGLIAQLKHWLRRWREPRNDRVE